MFNFFRRKKKLTHEQIMRHVLITSTFTQKELATFLKVNDSTVHRWLIGARQISPKYWKLLIQLDPKLNADDFLGENKNGD
nr:hypothetical protein [uncultured Mediterranean phage uvMED]BAR29897.1 hypothetical protein [uncultured Mediterranean phage uvMED]BAR29958.1 hypothetical protein [uncultured Mediterranean phage uvMED]